MLCEAHWVTHPVQSYCAALASDPTPLGQTEVGLDLLLPYQNEGIGKVR